MFNRETSMTFTSKLIEVKMLCLSLVFLTSCSTIFDNPPPVEFIKTPIVITVKENPYLPENVVGRSTIKDNIICDIELQRYPYCLLHEIRHCLEGDWHGNLPNADDCYND